MFGFGRKPTGRYRVPCGTVALAAPTPPARHPAALLQICGTGTLVSIVSEVWYDSDPTYPTESIRLFVRPRSIVKLQFWTVGVRMVGSRPPGAKTVQPVSVGALWQLGAIGVSLLI